jgi:hypothetical protein
MICKVEFVSCRVSPMDLRQCNPFLFRLVLLATCAPFLSVEALELASPPPSPMPRVLGD